MPTTTNVATIMIAVVAAAAAAVGLVGCASETVLGQAPQGEQGKSNGGNNADGVGTGSAPACTPNTGDGKSACIDEMCSAGEYCHVSGGYDRCQIGCTTSANCGAGDYCDLSDAKDSLGDKVGTCRACTPTAATTTTVAPSDPATPAAKCGAYAGAYDFVLTTGSSSDCKAIIGGTAGECTFAQNACLMTQSCVGSGNAASFEIDSTNAGTFSLTQSGAKLSCDYKFSGDATDRAVSMECQITGGKAVTCNFIGTLR